MTHDFKFSAVYDLPFGKGRSISRRVRRLDLRRLAHFEHQSLRQRNTRCNVTTSHDPSDLRDRRFGIYPRAAPMSLPITAGSQATAEDSIRPSILSSSPIAAAARSCNGPFPNQGSGTALNAIGNETRYNPKLRLFPNLNENMSLTRTFPIHEEDPAGIPRRGIQRLQSRPLRHRQHAVAKPDFRRADRVGQPDQYAS